MKDNYENLYRGLLNTDIECSCGRIHRVPIKKVLVAKNALQEIPQILCDLGYYHHIHMVCDSNTFDVFGRKLAKFLSTTSHSVKATIFLSDPLIPDEQAIYRLTQDVEDQSTCIVGVGSGTINDLCRYVAHKLGKPYIIVATAPSMDGYASSVSPLIIQGFKKTFSAKCAEAIIADLDILCEAPTSLISAGFGDIIGKLTCKTDWKLGALLHHDYFCEYISSLVDKSVEVCIQTADGLQEKKEDAIESLMHALILSGIGMLMAGNSRPASGSEHHLSHFWEMRFLQEKRTSVLHGHKVGVASTLMAHIYNYLASLDKPQILINTVLYKGPGQEERLKQVKDVFGKLADDIFAVSFNDSTLVKNPDKIFKEWRQIRDILQMVPSSEYIISLLSKVGAPVHPDEIAVEKELVYQGICNCMYVRNIYTVLRLTDELGMLEETAKMLCEG